MGYRLFRLHRNINITDCRGIAAVGSSAAQLYQRSIPRFSDFNIVRTAFGYKNVPSILILLPALIGLPRY